MIPQFWYEAFVQAMIGAWRLFLAAMLTKSVVRIVK